MIDCKDLIKSTASEMQGNTLVSAVVVASLDELVCKSIKVCWLA